MSDFMAEIKSETKKYGGGQSGDYYAFKEGVNRMRLLAQPKVIAYHFPTQGRPDVCIGVEEGCPHHKADKNGEVKKPTIRLCTYIIDRDDNNRIKFAELPLSISYSINDLQKDSDFAFSEFPMEYDVKITHDPKNADPKAKYRLVASPKMEPLSDIEKQQFEAAMAKMSPEQYVEKRKEAQRGKGLAGATEKDFYPETDVNADEIPF